MSSSPSPSNLGTWTSEWNWMSGFTIFAIVFIITTYVKRRRNKEWNRSCQLLKNFQGPPSIPFFGNALLLNRENHELFEFVETQVKNFGKVSKLWLFHKPYILVSDADVAEKILSGRTHLEKGDDIRNVFNRWWGSGLLTASVDKWSIQRKLLNHTFSHSVLMGFLEIFNKESDILTQTLGIFSKNGSSFNIIPHITKCTLNIICETAMGKRLSSSGDENREYIDAVTGMYHILLSRMTRPWLRPDFIWNLTFGPKEQQYLKILHGFTERVIAEKRAHRKEHGGNNNLDGKTIEGQKVRMAFMDYLLEHDLTNEEIRNQVDTFMAAGHDTTAYTVAWTLFLLALHPEHQLKVQKELDEIFKDEPHRSVTSTDLSKMPWISLCIKEALRMYPIVPFNIRKTSQEIIIDENRTIPSNINVVIMPYMMHKDRDYFKNPEEFNPERFLADNCTQHHNFSYIPFSAGPRQCVGQKFGIYEAKIILSYLLRSYNWISLDHPKCIQLDLDLVIRSMHGLHFKITKR